MAWHLSWKEKVVLSIGLWMLLNSYVISAQSIPPNRTNTRITFSCQNIRLEEALQRLSLKAGVFFIYSSSWLEADKLVSIKATHQPLPEVLDMIGRSLQLTFRYKGKYVIVKRNEPQKKIQWQVSQPEKQEVVIASADLSGTLPAFKKPDLTIPVFTPITPPAKPLFQYQKPVLDTMSLLSVIQPKDQLRKNWFVAGGLLFNDFVYGGIEFRGGYRSVFTVFNTSLTKEGFYRAGYGVGIRLPSSNKKLSYTVIYTYAQLKAEKKMVVHKGRYHTLVESGYKLFVRHNQIRIGLQYTLTSRLNLHLGTSWNFTDTYYQPKLFVAKAVHTRIMVLQRNNTPENAIHIASKSLSPAPATVTGSALPVYHTPNMWLGWELGIFYRFQF